MTAIQKPTPISFKAKLSKIKTWTIVRLPESASLKLPSRGQVMVTGTMNGVQFQTPLEPDGKWGHWFRVNKALQNATHATLGDTASLVVTPVKQWPEPTVPEDLQRALTAHPKVHDLWRRITPMARWEWIRWIRATGQQETRVRRIEVACSKMAAGDRRPCCWNRNLCTEPAVSRKGVLLEPTDS